MASGGSTSNGQQIPELQVATPAGEPRTQPNGGAQKQRLAFKLPKRGLATEEYEECIKSKLEDLLSKDLEPMHTRCLECVLKYTFLRKTKSGALDKRRLSTQNIREYGAQPGAETGESPSPTASGREGGRRKGEQHPGKALAKSYHEYQDELLLLGNLPSEYNIGPHRLEKDGKPISTEDYCDVIDELLSREWLKKIDKSEKPTTITSVDRDAEECKKLFARASRVVYQRFFLDMDTPNDWIMVVGRIGVII